MPFSHLDGPSVFETLTDLDETTQLKTYRRILLTVSECRLLVLISVPAPSLYQLVLQHFPQVNHE